MHVHKSEDKSKNALWDFGLVLSKVFVARVRQLNTTYVFI